MSSVGDSIECPSCKFEYADWNFDCESGDESVFCRRCGFSGYFSYEENKRKESGGQGCYMLKSKEQIGCAAGTCDDEIIEELEHLSKDELQVCLYTFKKEEQWFFKDLLTDEVLPFKVELSE